MFRENTAYSYAGAVAALGPALSTLVIEDSVFDSNAVRAPTDEGGGDVTLRLNTGGFPIGAVEGYAVPIWRVDDGPVYGIPWEQCQSAAERSEEAVRKGFPASWPNLQCANASYTGPDDTFNHVLSLTPGSHTLWTGLFVMVSHVLIASPSVL